MKSAAPRAPPGRAALGEETAGTRPIVAKQLADAKLPGDPIATPGEIGERPSIMTVDIPGGDIAPWAAGCRLCGRTQEGDLGLRFIDTPGVELERCGLRQPMGQRVSNLQECEAKGPMRLNQPLLIYTRNGDGTGLTKSGQEPGLFCKKQDETFFPSIQTSRSGVPLARNQSVKLRAREVSILRECVRAPRGNPSHERGLASSEGPSDVLRKHGHD